MRTKFNLEKAVQAAAVLLRAEGKSMSRLRLLKLLYLAERKCLEMTGCPFLGGRLVLMHEGPLHSEVYDLIKGNYKDEAAWSRYVSKDGQRDIHLDDEPEMSELSPFETRLLNGLVEDRMAMDDFAVADETHELPEIKGKRPPKNEVKELPILDIMRAACPAEHLEEMMKELRERTAFDVNRARLHS